MPGVFRPHTSAAALGRYRSMALLALKETPRAGGKNNSSKVQAKRKRTSITEGIALSQATNWAKEGRLWQPSQRSNLTKFMF